MFLFKYLFCVSAVAFLCSANYCLAEECLTPGELVLAHGNLRQIEYPGPPDYIGPTNGDTTEHKWVLVLSDEEIKCAINAPEGDKTRIQLDIPDNNASAFKNQDVYVGGHLFYSTKRSEHTPMLIAVTAISVEDPNAPEPQPKEEKTQPKPAPKRKAGAIGLDVACDSYFGMIEESYLYSTTEKPSHARAAIQFANKIFLSSDYVDYLVEAMSTNARDAQNASMIHSGRVKERKGITGEGNMEYGITLLGCYYNPAQLIPNYQELHDQGLIFSE